MKFSPKFEEANRAAETVLGRNRERRAGKSFGSRSHETKIMKRFDWTIWLGVFVGLTAIVAGAWLEDLNIGFLWHPTAALIVGGGTLGAVIIRRGVGGVTSAVQSRLAIALEKRRRQNSSNRTGQTRVAFALGAENRHQGF